MIASDSHRVLAQASEAFMISLKSFIVGAAFTAITAGSLSAQLALGPEQSSSAIAKRQQELAKDKHELRADHRERGADRREIASDRKELKGDARKLRQDRR